MELISEFIHSRKFLENLARLHSLSSQINSIQLIRVSISESRLLNRINDYWLGYGD